MRKTAEETARTREKILRVALQCLADEGWAGMSFVRVAQLAGVTRGAVHHHFADKNALLHAALAQAWQDYPAGAFEHLHDTGRDPAERLVAFVAGYVDELRDNPGFRTLAVVSTLVAPQAGAQHESGPESLQQGLDEKQAAMSIWSDQIRSVLKELAAAGRLVLDLETAVFLIASTTYGMTVNTALGQAALPDAEAAQALAERLLHAVTGP